jgi:uncharacterized protein with von Willebrand factor type A (vWA) domain
MTHESSEVRLAQEFEALRALLAAAGRDELRQRRALAQLGAELHRLGEQLRRQRTTCLYSSAPSSRRSRSFTSSPPP